MGRVRASARTLVCLGVFCVSCAGLLMEVCLTRIFSYTIWYHFAFLVISMALLGFGASGSLLTLCRRYAGTDAVSARWLPWTLTAACAGLILAVLVISGIPFNPFSILEDRQELWHGFFYLVVVTLPFMFVGATIAIALDAFSEEAGTLYFADLVGAGLGCLSFIFLMDRMGPRGVLATSGALLVLAMLLLAQTRRGLVFLIAPLLLAGLFGTLFIARFTPCDSKLASRFVNQMDGELLWTKWSPIFRTDVYAFPRHQARDGKGLSYTSIGTSRQYEPKRHDVRFIAHDGDACAVMVRADSPVEEMPLWRGHMLTIAHHMRPHADVFIGGAGGGVDMMAALAMGAKSIDAVELDPYTVDVVSEHFADYLGNIAQRDNVVLRVGDARSELRRGDRRYDVIQFTGVDTITAIGSGAYLLSEAYLYTVDAMHDYFDHLTDDGILSLTSQDIINPAGPPRMTPRFCSVVAAALEERGVSDPGACCVVMADFMPEDNRMLALCSVLAKTSPYTDEELARLRQFADDNGFVFWHFPGTVIDTAASTILTLSPAERQLFYERSYLDFSPVTDNRPFFMQFYKWRHTLVADYMAPNYLGATGNLVLLGGLVFAVVFALVLIVIPAVVAARGRIAQPGQLAVNLVYFSAIGIGFMFLEMALIQRLALFLGYPTYSLSVSLFSMLVFAGIGSYVTRNISSEPGKAIWRRFGLIVAVVVAYVLIGDVLLSELLFLPLLARILISILAIAPLGLALGGFFPLGIRELHRRQPGTVPLAWAANGSSSVVATLLAVFLATLVGFKAVFAIALGLYLLAALCFPKSGGVEGPAAV
ncbi:MAG TPA: hypothetical protein PLM14_16145 [Candidatus Hydrogenedentes bacterium]|nr:hypothetical protein [Candidatus Hydrogenedentota bacterium]HQM49877.1 hypothetical protein [Candidatus Hydrogenedentota bacterium]